MWKILGNDFGSFMSIKCSFHCDFFFFWGGSISVLLINLNSDNLVTFLFYFFILLYDFAIFCFQLSFSSELSICTLLFKFGFCVCVCVCVFLYVWLQDLFFCKIHIFSEVMFNHKFLQVYMLWWQCLLAIWLDMLHSERYLTTILSWYHLKDLFLFSIIYYS